MSAKKFEEKIELIEIAIELLGEEYFTFKMSDVYEVTGLSQNGQNLSMISWVAEQCGFYVFKSGCWVLQSPKYRIF